MTAMSQRRVGERPLWEDDGIVVDRVRSALGPLLKHLDQPRVHVAGAHGTITLHGDVVSTDARRAIEGRARQVLGVRSVESHLHIGLLRGDCVPSTGRRVRCSPLLRRLELIARDRGYFPMPESRFALRAVLGVFTALLPPREQRRLLQHLPSDVRRLATPAHWLTHDVAEVPTTDDVAELAAVALRGNRVAALHLLRAVLPAIREHVADDAETVADALPPELQVLWWGLPPAPLDPETEPHEQPWLLPVRAVMTRRLTTAPSYASLLEAYDVMTRARVHHLPVVDDDGRCVALVDAVSLARRLPEIWSSVSTPAFVREPGRMLPLSVLPDEPVARAAAEMRDSGVDACCVVDHHGRLIGLVTARDIVALVARAATGGRPPA